MFLPNRTVDDNTIEVLETDIPVSPPTKHCRKKGQEEQHFLILIDITIKNVD
jgi:hypothetical protein